MPARVTAANTQVAVTLSGSVDGLLQRARGQGDEVALQHLGRVHVADELVGERRPRAHRHVGQQVAVLVVGAR